MATPDFIILFQKYLDSTISLQELNLLRQAILAEEDKDKMDALLKQAFSDNRLVIHGDDDPEVMYLDFLNRVKQPAISVMRFRWMAAAACLLLLGTGTWFLTRTIQKNVPVPMAKTDIPAGGNKAILTLSGGQQIVLDSSRQGNVVNLGNIQITKTASSELKYQALAPAAGGPIVYNTLSTPRGGQYQLTLQDGTKVWLNAASSLKYPMSFNGPERVVELTGEGYFEVARNIKQPFIVRFNGVEIKVLGTEFNVMAYNDEPGGSQTTLINGGVAVSVGAERRLLSPGEAAVVDGRIRVKEVDVQPVIAWKNGEIALNNEDLASVMRQISRWYDVNVSFNGAVPRWRTGGMVKRNVNLSALLAFFEENGLHSTVNGRNIVFYQ